MRATHPNLYTRCIPVFAFRRFAIYCRPLRLFLCAAVTLLAIAPVTAQTIQVPATSNHPATTVDIYWACNGRTGLFSRGSGGGGNTASLPNAPSATLVSGRYYKQCTGAQRFAAYRTEVLSPTTFLFSGISAAINLANNTPTGWGQDFPGFLQRFGSAYGQSAIRSTVRYTLAAALHEDTRYLICHHCTVKEKAKNAVLASFTARHGADGHRAFSLTPTIASYSGPLVAYATWYPPGYDIRDAAVHGTTNIPIQMGIRFARELLLDRDTKCEKAAKEGNPCMAGQRRPPPPTP